MANIAILKPNNNQYLTSVNESDYLVDPTAPKSEVVTKDPDVLYNPDISAVKDIPLKYWKRVGKTVVEMTAQEKAVIDSAEATALQASKTASADKLEIPLEIVVTALVKLMNQKTRLGNTVTKADVITEVKSLL